MAEAPLVRWRFLCASLLGAGMLPCQQFLGLSMNSQATANSRGALGVNAGELITRIDGDEMAGWGTETAGTRSVRALYFVAQDGNGATPEVFDIVLYPEDATNPNMPDFNDPRAFAIGVPGPSGGPGPVAENLVVGLARPVAVPIRGGGDVFVSFRLPAAPAGDGIGVQVILGYQSGTFTVWDTPNLGLGGSPPPAGTAGTSYMMTRVGGTAVWMVRRQHLLDLAHGGAGGCGLTVTNQPSFVVSHLLSALGPPGTGDMLSGSHPDATGGNVGRVDDVTMFFDRTQQAAGTAVAFLVDFSSSFGPELPLRQFVPGSTGVTCLQQPQVFGFAVTAGGRAWLTTVVPPALRPLLPGVNLRQQAVGLDVGGALHAGPCDGMRF